MSVAANTWCILTTSPSRTVPLAAELAKADIEAWTPTEMVQVRVGRNRKRVERRMALVPSIVFADHAQLGRLIELARAPAQTFLRWDADEQRMVHQGLPFFKLFRLPNGDFPSVRDAALDPLREVERRMRPVKKGSTFEVGQTVRCPESGFEGLDGTVTGYQGRFAVVQFTGLPITVKIDARLLVNALNAA